MTSRHVLRQYLQAHTPLAIRVCVHWSSRIAGQETGYVPGENFFMVDPPTKKAHCLNWAVPAKYNCFFAVAFVVYTLATQSWSTKLQMTPAFDQVNSTHAALAFGIPACAFGYFYKEFGMWLPAKTWPDLVAKKTCDPERSIAFGACL